jgi:subtilisin family serine protease
MADFVAEPAPAQAGTHYFDGRFLRADDLMREQASAASNTNNYFTDDYSLTVGGSSGANLNTFAGQTVRLRIASVNNRGQLIVGVDDATIQPRASTGGGISDLVVDPSNRDTIYLGGTGRDVLVGGSGQDTQTAHELGHTLGLRHEHTRPASDGVAGDGVDDVITGTTPVVEQSGGISKLGSRRLVLQGDGTYTGDDDNNHGTHVAGTIGAVGNNGVGVAGSTSAGTTGTFRLTFNGQTTYSLRNLESLIDDLARDVAEATASGLSHIKIKTYHCPSY